MALSADTIKQFVAITNSSDTGSKEGTANATVVEYNDKKYAKLDGSDELTPITTSVKVQNGDRVVVTIKNHQAYVGNNFTNPAIGLMEEDGLRSYIKQTIDEISLTVENAVSDHFASLGITADSITTMISNQEGFSTFQQTVEEFSFMNAGGTVKISGGNIDLTGMITFSDLNDATLEAVQGTKRQFSTNLTDWHDTMKTGDIYRRDWNYTTENWDSPYQFVGTNGKDGEDGKDGSDGSDASVPTHITNTIIDQYQIQAQKIFANNFAIYPSDEKSTGGSFDIYGMFDRGQLHAFTIQYYDTETAPVVYLDSPCDAYMHFGHEPGGESVGSLIYFKGKVDFTDADVSGITAVFG